MTMSASDDATSSEALIFEAESLIDRRRYAQARQVLGRLLKIAPDHVQGLYLAAFIDYAEDHTDKALAATDGVLGLDPDHYGARRLRGLLLAEKNELAAAEREWIALLREYPEDAASYASYAELMLRTLEVDKARRLAAEGLRHEPEHEGCLYVLALVEIILDGGKAAHGDASSLQRLLAQYPARQQTSLALVVALSDRGNNRAALRVAQELLRAQPDSKQFVQLVRDLRVATHWSLLPLYPMQRWGWAGSFMTWGGFVLILMFAKQLPPAWSLGLSLTWLSYVIYSWVWPRILPKLLG
jgi:tetratricopeptide (TPR) repeat protein